MSSPDGLLERDPARVLDLVVVIGGGPGAELEQEEAHALGDQPAVAAVVIADVAERLDQLGVDAALLAHLARRRLLLGLVAVEVALRQRHDACAVRRAAGGHDQQHLAVAHDDAAGRDLLDPPSPTLRSALPRARAPCIHDPRI